MIGVTDNSFQFRFNVIKLNEPRRGAGFEVNRRLFYTINLNDNLLFLHFNCIDDNSSH